MSKNIFNRNTKGEYHGYIELYNLDGKLWFKCFFNNGIKINYDEYYTWNGGKLYKNFYI